MALSASDGDKTYTHNIQCRFEQLGVPQYQYITDLHVVQCLPLLSLTSVLSHWRSGGLWNEECIHVHKCSSHGR